MRKSNSQGMIESAPTRLGVGDAVWIGAILLLMAVYTYARARNRIFWGDELNAHLLLRESPFSKVMHDWRASMDSGSLFYVTFGRWWTQLFSSSPEMSLRTFSAAGVAASFVILWITARRFYSLLIVGACLPVGYFVNEIVRSQFYSGRMYGGFLAASALVIYAFVRVAPGERLTVRLLLLTFFAHLFLMSSHVLGPLYSGGFIAGLIAQDLWARQFRLPLYLSALAGWIVLFVSFANVRNTAALSKLGYFTVPPHLVDFFLGLTVYSRTSLVILAVLAAAAIFVSRGFPASAAQPPSRRPVNFVLLSLLAILLVAFVTSRLVTSIFYNRYLLPLYLGDILLLCELVYRISCAFPQTARYRNAGVALGLVCFVAVYGHYFGRPFRLPLPDYTAGLVQKTPPGLPIVFTDVGMFTEMEYYRGNASPMVAPLDWSVALDPHAGPGGADDTLQLERWKTAGVFAGHIESSPAILAQYPAFLLVTLPDRSLWLQRYIRDNPRYTVTSEGNYHEDDLWLVRLH